MLILNLVWWNSEYFICYLIFLKNYTCHKDSCMTESKAKTIHLDWYVFGACCWGLCFNNPVVWHHHHNAWPKTLVDAAKFVAFTIKRHLNVCRAGFSSYYLMTAILDSIGGLKHVSTTWDSCFAAISWLPIQFADICCWQVLLLNVMSPGLKRLLLSCW